MNRRYETADFERAVSLLRGFCPDVAITTDVLTGFPGETGEEFLATLAFCEKIGFAKTHIFPYSRRKGTAAEKMPDQVRKSVREERARLLAAAAARSERAFIGRFIGRTLPVLFEQEVSPGLFEGLTPHYVTVRAPSGRPLRNVTAGVLLTENGGTLALGALR
jgi:threonylcarbamoyladenosine tRNA methylthiotransferase MtaB